MKVSFNFGLLEIGIVFIIISLLLSIWGYYRVDEWNERPDCDSDTNFDDIWDAEYCISRWGGFASGLIFTAQKIVLIWIIISLFIGLVFIFIHKDRQRYLRKKREQSDLNPSHTYR